MKKKSIFIGTAGLAIALGLCACGQKEVTTTASISESGNDTSTVSVSIAENVSSSVELSSGSNVGSGSSASELKSTSSSSASLTDVSDAGAQASDVSDAAEVSSSGAADTKASSETEASAEVSSSGAADTKASSETEASAEVSSSGAAADEDSSETAVSAETSNTGSGSAEGSGNEITAESNGSDLNDITDKSAEIDSQGHKKVTVKATGDVLIDADGFYAEITDKKTDEFGYSWEIRCENNTGSTVYFGMESVSVNGVVAVPLFQAEVEPGSSAEVTATWNMDLTGYGIETPVIIEGKTIIIDKENYSMLSQAQFAVCPEGEDKAYYVTRDDEETDINIISNDYVNLTCVSFSQDEFENAVMSVYLNNKSDKNITLSMDGCFINDVEADPFWAAFLPAGKCVYTNIYWPISDLQAAGIDSFDSIQKIAAEISVYDQETYEVYSNEIVTLTM